MKPSYRQAARDDLIRQFRYYLADQDLPEVAVRFRESVLQTVQWLLRNSLVGPLHRPGIPQLPNLRSWPVAAFEAIRIYYLPDEDAIHIIRILHCKRDVKRILGRESVT